ncbi:MAG: isoprenylcysteine carboxylmethyltransferase family protein [Parvibaculum sp.]|nr:isoprenylcysteine carboxylmethyltransferase family protein [Parvibaculum sp.]
MQQNLLPPRLFQIGLILMVVLDLMLGGRPVFAGGISLVAGIILILAGIGITIGGAGQFSRVKTNINTFYKPDHLVTDGFFRWSRNPMYLGFAMVLTGAALVLNSWEGLIIATGFVIIADRWYIGFEEAVMTETFGEAYKAYCRTTRRWL